MTTADDPKKTSESNHGTSASPVRLHRVDVKNFRLLMDVSLCFDRQSTVIVGRNNSGKTSLTELFRRWLQDERSARFRLEDFSLSAYDTFWHAFLLNTKATDEQEVREALPVIETRVTVAYEDSANLALLSEFIVDLDPATTEAVALLRYEPTESAAVGLFEGIAAGSDDPESPPADFFKKLSSRITTYYQASLCAVDPNDETNTKTLEWSKLRALLKAGFINAQRGLDDVTYRDRDVLGKTLESLFRTAANGQPNSDDRQVAESLKLAVEKVQESIEGDFREHLEKLLPTFDLFGYPGLTDPQLRTETTLEVDRLLTDHTRIRYGNVEGVSLPESHNGLGIRNLIFILLQLLAFFKDFQAKSESTALQVIFIEEPEAHLHPQMQEVFISKLAEISNAFSKGYGGGCPWPVQFVVTTHSPHIANRAPFDATRYFMAIPSPQPAPNPDTGKRPPSCGGNSCIARIKDLQAGPKGMKTPDRDFLHKYMTLTRCDLFFADKAVLIEGASERLLLPEMIARTEDDQPPSERRLSSQYVSVVEVGGAYAHCFYDLLDFLELRTLIITDLDSVVGSPRGKACPVSTGSKTSNACIKQWFEPQRLTPTELVEKSPEDKTRSRLRLAYQVPETNGAPCGRSFEGAFMLANQELFDLSGSDEEKEASVLQKTEKLKKKTDFALKYAIDERDWQVPRYIAEGLKWLAQGSNCGSPEVADAGGDGAETTAGDSHP